MFDWTADLIAQGGYFGVFALMLAENLFPPIPSEIIMPLAGYNAARGELNVFGVILAGTLGSVLGTLAWYYAGRLVGVERVKRWAARWGRWMTVTPGEIDMARYWFLRYGWIAAFLGRLFPIVRTLISVPAGVAPMPLVPFLVFTALGSALWTSGLTLAGYILESQYEVVEHWLDPLSTGVLVLVIVVYLYRVVTFKPDSK